MTRLRGALRAKAAAISASASETHTHTHCVCPIAATQLSRFALANDPSGEKECASLLFSFQPSSFTVVVHVVVVVESGGIQQNCSPFCSMRHFIHRNTRRTHVTDQAANSQKNHSPPDKETYSKRGFRLLCENKKEFKMCAQKTNMTFFPS